MEIVYEDVNCDRMIHRQVYGDRIHITMQQSNPLKMQL